ncbi:hypothetical protein MMC10_009423 [Thelotrema lepadinum]|nr:hypothetical protein [Thelotrema lepadinum]
MSSLKPLPKSIDTVIIGNGPAALILSYILHGNCPFYDTTCNPHPDSILDSKLGNDILCDVEDVEKLTAHFQNSRFSYSTAALPINVLLDTLLRPLADTDPGTFKSCIKWRKLEERAVPHLLLGSTNSGGQWASNPVRASWDIGSLSYLDQLSLPGYSLRDHLGAECDLQDSEFLRPTRAQIADYLAAYPAKVGIEDSIYPLSAVSEIVRTDDGFHVGSHSISCKRLVLASGIFSNLLPARPPLQPLLKLPHFEGLEPPLLVVGSGFSAADIIITNLRKRKIIHIFKWDPDNRPSPLRACHKQAYPEYAGVYRQMKLAALTMFGDSGGSLALTRRTSNTLKNVQADPNYQGFPNTFIADASNANGVGNVKLQLPSGESIERTISNLEYVIGRRGSLSYLEPLLRTEVVGTNMSAEESDRISGRTLRSKAETDLEVAPNVFVVGSLTGDSLIRYAYGSCAYAAAKIVRGHEGAAVEEVTEALENGKAITAKPNGNIPNGSANSISAGASTKDSEAPRTDLEAETAEPIKRSRWDRLKRGSCVIC